MEHSPILKARAQAERSVRRADTLAAILAQTQGDCPLDLAAAVEAAMAAGMALDQTEGQIILLEVLGRVLELVDSPSGPGPALDTLAALGAEAALAAFNTLVASSFPDGNVDIARLGDGALVVMARLLASAGQIDDALAVLGTGAQGRPIAFLARAHAVRGHIFGRDASTRPLWADVPGTGSGPLDPRLHRHRARACGDAGDLAGALDGLLTGACLPIDAADKAGLGHDFAVVGVMLRAIGQTDWLGQTARLRFCLAACPAIAAEAAAALRDWPSGGAFDLYGPGLLVPLQQWFSALALAPPPTYPLRQGKPHVDVVWLEITNFCNQKCTFCPDMHREDARQWLPLDQVKRVIDQLAEHVSVGSMQLNAYGEPLLHPQFGEILAYIRAKNLPWPTFFTTHGMTLQPKKLKALSHNYPAGIAVSLHNDSQDSYDRSRSAKVGDYATLVSRLTDLLTQMVDEGAPSHVRLYQMVCNGHEDPRVPPETRAAFADSPERMTRHVRKWEAIAARIAEQAPQDRHARALTNSFEAIRAAFLDASHGDGNHLPIMRWTDTAGNEQIAFMSPRPVGTYANLLLEYDPRWTVTRSVVNRSRCGFTQAPSLAVFATGKLGICCLDLHSTATFGSLSDFDHIGHALQSDAARRIFAELANGVATSKGCQICLASGEQLCGPS